MDDSLPKMPPEVRQYIESLISDSGGGDLDEHSKSEVIDQIYQRLDNFLASVLIENLPADKVAQFTRLNEAGATEEEVKNFLNQNIPDAQHVMSQAFVDFREMFLKGFTGESSTPNDGNNATS